MTGSRRTSVTSSRPIGFWNERLDPRWINKLPDIPLAMRQVIPDGLTVTGLQFRGAKYLFGSPIKMEYSVFASNGLGVPGAGKRGRLGRPRRAGRDHGQRQQRHGLRRAARVLAADAGHQLRGLGIRQCPVQRGIGAVYSIWQPYFNYHRGNWDFRFEYGNSYENTKTFIGNNIRREGTVRPDRLPELRVAPPAPPEARIRLPVQRRLLPRHRPVEAGRDDLTRR